ncbi:metalloregulator ArsR/SmtB family transcription factor [Gymnodinialimonas sp. 2305UL16-5]|uniref:ArsR/SmtB family transcription factor n=1 Tax=Gymnodinialimonas mytili TaxID=3126503 RepID=UPI0030B4C0E1
MNESDQLDAAFSALAHPARRAILAHLAKGTASVNALAEPFDMSLPAVSKHIRVLESAGLITREKHAQFRLCKLEAEPIRDISNWTDQYRHIWAARFDVMDNLLNDMKESDQ